MYSETLKLTFECQGRGHGTGASLTSATGAAAVFIRARCFDGGIERQQVGLAGDVVSTGKNPSR
jgi:hypothetical protein